MEKKLNRGKLIRKYIGEGLKEDGFVYDGYKGDVWEFRRTVQDNVVQFIGVNLYRFDPWEITFYMGTSRPGKKNISAKSIKGLDGDGRLGSDYWKYQDEESLIQVLKKMVGFIKTQGLEILDEASKPVMEYATEEMYHKLYLHHKELSDEFIRKTGVSVTGYDRENLDRWYDCIEDRLKELRKKEYDEIRDDIVEMAAFLGEQFLRYRKGKWIEYENGYGKYLCLISYPEKAYSDIGDSTMNLIKVVTRAYAGLDREAVMYIFWNEI